jgi:hypothetical protein
VVLPDSGESHCTVCDVSTSLTTPVGTESVTGFVAHQTTTPIHTSKATRSHLRHRLIPTMLPALRVSEPDPG